MPRQQFYQCKCECYRTYVVPAESADAARENALKVFKTGIINGTVPCVCRCVRIEVVA